MDPLFLVSLLGGLSSLLGGATTYVIARLGKKARGRELAEKGQSATYRERMDKLLRDLTRASAEMDQTLVEMSMVSKERETALSELETKLQDLSGREQELQKRVDTLKQVPVPAVQYLLEATSKAERRSATRDYVLFGLGVVVSTVVTIVLKVAFGI
jgi:septal ring factor EnvC (AmiA/AmiB activator)